VIRVASPSFTLNGWQYSHSQSNDAFWFAQPLRQQPPQRLTEAELNQKRQRAFSIALKVERRGGAQTLVKSLIITLIDMAVFAAHWLIA
jgi:hypothetical protein